MIWYKGYGIAYEGGHVRVYDNNVLPQEASWTEDTVHDAMITIDELEEEEENE